MLLKFFINIFHVKFVFNDIFLKGKCTCIQDDEKFTIVKETVYKKNMFSKSSDLIQVNVCSNVFKITPVSLQKIMLIAKKSLLDQKAFCPIFQKPQK